MRQKEKADCGRGMKTAEVWQGKEGLSCGRQISGRAVRQTGAEGCMGTGLDQEVQNCAAFRQYTVPPLVVGLRSWAELCVA